MSNRPREKQRKMREEERNTFKESNSNRCKNQIDHNVAVEAINIAYN